MKTISNILKGLGISMLFIGGSAMDSASLVVPFVIAFAGIGFMYLGVQIEEVYT